MSDRPASTRQQRIDDAFAKSHSQKAMSTASKDSNGLEAQKHDDSDGEAIVELEDEVEELKDEVKEMNIADSVNADAAGIVKTPSDNDTGVESIWSEEEIKGAFEKADILKAEGNDFFKMKEYDSAMNLYTECIDSCPSDDCRVSVYYCNRAACYLALEEYTEAVEDCTEALALNKSYVKALVRRAKAYESLDKLEDALEDFKKAVELDATTKVAVDGVKRLTPVVKERQEKLKEEMMGKLKDLGNTVLGKFGMSLDAFKMTQQPDGSYSVGYNP